MLAYLLLVSLLAFAVWGLARHRLERLKAIRHLATRRAGFAALLAPAINSPSPTPAQRRKFEEGKLAAIADFLEPKSLARLQQACLDAEPMAERSYIPRHKQGGTVSYEALHEQAPACIALYHDPSVRRWLEDLLGVPVQRTPDDDQSSCSLLVYDTAGDHIGWHYDHNFYRGRHFTVLLSLINRDACHGPAQRLPRNGATTGCLSAGRLQRQGENHTTTVESPENTLIVFEGARVRHRATAVAKGEKRIMLSMTFCTDPGRNPLKNLARRIKDTAYFGPRALID
jgi:hypothetical protein